MRVVIIVSVVMSMTLTSSPVMDRGSDGRYMVVGWRPMQVPSASWNKAYSPSVRWYGLTIVNWR